MHPDNLFAQCLGAGSGHGRIVCDPVAGADGCRLEEIWQLRWEAVDFENSCLSLPDSKTDISLLFAMDLDAANRGQTLISYGQAERTRMGRDPAIPSTYSHD